MKPNKSNRSTIQSVKGTRDFYPETMAVRSWLYETAHRVSASFGYQEWDGPFLETIDLYAAKSGEELVKEQSFVFPDRGGDLITLRPELTPTLARMIAQRQKQLVFPVRWWSWGPFWRYEKPQRGRTREFFQWNIDLLGVDSPEADAELVAIAASFLEQVGLTPEMVGIYVNNRRLMDSEFEALGIPAEKRPDVLHLVDRRDKMTPAEWLGYAADIGLSQAQIEGLQVVLGDSELWRKSEEMRRFFAAIDAMGVSAYVSYAPYVIRGLDYYTGTVFECYDRKREFRAILGGGRYDNLVRDVGGEPLTGVGYAMGDLVISLVLERYNLLPPDSGLSPAAILVTVFDEASFSASLALAARLRRAGLSVACYPEATKISRQVKYADRMNMRLAIILGPDELASEQVAVKDLRTAEQTLMAQDDLEKALRRLLGVG